MPTRPIHLKLRTLGLLVAVVLGSGALLALHAAMSEARDGPRGPESTISAVAGAAKVTSRAGTLLAVSNTVPGQSATATVEIANGGDAPGAFHLRRSGLSDVPGPGGGSLSKRLHLLVEDITIPRRPAELYRGRLGAMTLEPLGTFGAGEAHSYRFTVTFRRGGTPSSPTSGDNAYQGSAVVTDYEWVASAPPGLRARSGPRPRSWPCSRPPHAPRSSGLARCPTH